MEFKRLPSLTRNTSTWIAFLQRRRIPNKHCYTKWETDSSLQYFLVRFPFPPCKCVPPPSPFWNLIRLQGLFNVQRWAQINFLRLFSHGKSFIGMNVLQSQERGKLMKNKYHETHCALLKQPSGLPSFNSGTEAVGTLPLIPRHSGCLNSINTQCYWGQKGIHYFLHSVLSFYSLYCTTQCCRGLFCLVFVLVSSKDMNSITVRSCLDEVLKSVIDSF